MSWRKGEGGRGECRRHWFESQNKILAITLLFLQSMYLEMSCSTFLGGGEWAGQRVFNMWVYPEKLTHHTLWSVVPKQVGSLAGHFATWTSSGMSRMQTVLILSHHSKVKEQTLCEVTGVYEYAGHKNVLCMLTAVCHKGCARSPIKVVRDNDHDLGCAFHRNSAEFRRNLAKSHLSERNVKVRSTGMCYNTILDMLVHSGWYLSTRFLHVENARTYSK